MGHGNYLISEYMGETIKQNATDGRKEVKIRFEVRFNKYDKELYPYKNYVLAELAGDRTGVVSTNGSCISEMPAALQKRVQEEATAPDICVPSVAEDLAPRMEVPQTYGPDFCEDFATASPSEQLTMF
jgi:hypothetical protein